MYGDVVKKVINNRQSNTPSKTMDKYKTGKFKLYKRRFIPKKTDMLLKQPKNIIPRGQRAFSIWRVAFTVKQKTKLSKQ